NGCHQARAIEGFHLLGEERDARARVNALAAGASPHLAEIIGWRAENLRAMGAGAARTTAPLPFADHTANGAYAAHCGLGDPGFRHWTCDAGLRCADVYGDDVGACSPPTNPAGDACETSRTKPDANGRADDAFDDRV